jgi:hypothetical protein
LNLHPQEEASRPEMFFHSFDPTYDFASEKNMVYIFHNEGVIAVK